MRAGELKPHGGCFPKACCGLSELLAAGGQQKYLLLTDNNCALHASQSVMFSSQVGALYIGSWYGSFPVPPKGVKDVYLIND